MFTRYNFVLQERKLSKEKHLMLVHFVCIHTTHKDTVTEQ